MVVSVRPKDVFHCVKLIARSECNQDVAGIEPGRGDASWWRLGLSCTDGHGDRPNENDGAEQIRLAVRVSGSKDVEVKNGGQGIKGFVEYAE